MACCKAISEESLPDLRAPGLPHRVPRVLECSGGCKASTLPRPQDPDEAGHRQMLLVRLRPSQRQHLEGHSGCILPQSVSRRRPAWHSVCLCLVIIGKKGGPGEGQALEKWINPNRTYHPIRLPSTSPQSGRPKVKGPNLVGTLEGTCPIS